MQEEDFGELIKIRRASILDRQVLCASEVLTSETLQYIATHSLNQCENCAQFGLFAHSQKNLTTLLLFIIIVASKDVFFLHFPLNPVPKRSTEATLYDFT